MCRGDAVVEQLPSRSSPASAINPANVQLNPAVACCKGCCVGSSVSLLPDAACCRNECCKLLDGVCNPCNSATPTNCGHVNIFWLCQQTVARHCGYINRFRLRLSQNRLWLWLCQEMEATDSGYVNRIRLWLSQQIVATTCGGSYVKKLWQDIVVMSTDSGCGYVNKATTCGYLNRMCLCQQNVAVAKVRLWLLLKLHCGRCIELF